MVLIYQVAQFDSVLDLPFMIRLPSAIVFLLAGIGIDIAAFIAFRRAKTTVNPLKPSNANRLVTLGVFQYTRNPMYLGMVFIALASVIYLNCVYGLLVIFGLVAYLNRFQIGPEERAMTELFGDDFIQYTQRVRRWV